METLTNSWKNSAEKLGLYLNFRPKIRSISKVLNSTYLTEVESEEVRRAICYLAWINNVTFVTYAATFRCNNIALAKSYQDDSCSEYEEFIWQVQQSFSEFKL